MSLINDMLQDLDRADLQEKPVLPAGLTADKPSPSASPRRHLLPALAGIAVVYALLVEWNLLGLIPEKKAPLGEIPQPIALNSKWLNQAPSAAAPAAAVTAEPVTGSADVAATEIETQSDNPVIQQENIPPVVQADTPATLEPKAVEIERIPAVSTVEPLLDAARLALAANRLTTPVGDNAYELFKSALVLDPQNAAAEAGVETIRQRYLSWLDQALSDNRAAAARLYLQKARSVGVDHTILAGYENRLAQTPAATANETGPVAHEAAPAPHESAAALQVLPQVAITPAKIANDTEVAERIRSFGLRAEAEALELVTRGRGVAQSAVALADVYAERQARSQLQRLANLLANKTESSYAYVAAHIWLLDGQESRAKDALSSVEFDGLAERQRQRLLAGLRQRAGEYGPAMELYSQLVAISPENVADWLGLAVSADRSGLTNTALEAYEKVLLLRHPDQRVTQFARQRQQDLSLAAMTR